MGSQILATVSAIFALVSIFTSFFYDSNWFLILAQILYCLASACASALVFQAIRTRRALLMAPMMLVAIINIVALVIVFVVCLLTSFGVSTSINANVQWTYDHDPVWAAWFNLNCQFPVDENGKVLDADQASLASALLAYEKGLGAWGSFSSFFITIFAVWVFIVHFDCFRTLKAGEGYPTAQYHGNDNITVPIYPTYPAPAYDAAAAAASANPAPAYPGTPYDVPPSYSNAAATTGDETPVKVPLP